MKPKYPVKTFFVRSKSIPEFISVNKIYYEVNQTPINSGVVPESGFDVLLVDVNTRLIYTATVSKHQRLSCMFF